MSCCCNSLCTSQISSRGAGQLQLLLFHPFADRPLKVRLSLALPKRASFAVSDLSHSESPLWRRIKGAECREQELGPMRSLSALLPFFALLEACEVEVIIHSAAERQIFVQVSPPNGRVHWSESLFWSDFSG